MADGNTSISDVAGLLVAVDFIRDTCAEMNEALKAQNGKLDDLSVDVAVLCEWRKGHNETHMQMKDKQNWDNWKERGLIAAGLIAAAVAGRFKDG